MTSGLEGALLSGHCLFHAMMQTLINKNVLSTDDIKDIVSDAEGHLAAMPPDMMSAEARDFARGLIRNALR